jgi:hypothetical protein
MSFLLKKMKNMAELLLILAILNYGILGGIPLLEHNNMSLMLMYGLLESLLEQKKKNNT